MPLDILNIFVDEAGDPTLFANRRRAIVGTEGCSQFFILGKLEVDDPAGLGLRLESLSIGTSKVHTARGRVSLTASARKIPFF